jgi:signal transduction histidine kinase/predicted negative regulator of RcsB-dependent stress response
LNLRRYNRFFAEHILCAFFLFVGPCLWSEQSPFDKANGNENKPSSNDTIHALIEQSDELRLQRHYDSALECAGKAEALLLQTNDPATTVELRNLIGNIHKNTRNYSKAVLQFDAAMEMAKTLNDDEMTARIATNLGTTHERNRNPEQALFNYEKALHLYEKLGNETETGHLLELIADSHTSTGRFEIALEHDYESLRHYDRAKNINGRVRILNHMSSLYRRLGLNDRALEPALNAYKIANETGYGHGISLASKELGMIYESLGRLDDAQNYLEQFLAQAVQNGNKAHEASACRNIANVLLQKGQAEAALRYAKRANSLDIPLSEVSGAAAIKWTTGDIHLEMGQMSEALAAYRKALTIAVDAQRPWEEANTEIRIGRYYMALHQPEEAQTAIKKGIALAEQIGDKPLLSLGYKTLLELKRNAASAVETLAVAEKYLCLQDELNDQTRQSRVSDLITFNAVETKQREIDRLSREATIQKLEANARQNELDILEGKHTIQSIRLEQEKSGKRYYFTLMLVSVTLLLAVSAFYAHARTLQLKLKRLNAAKDAFFSIMAHDLKDLVGSLFYGIPLLRRTFDTALDADGLQLLSDLDHTARNSQALLENLLDWGRIQMNQITPQLEPVSPLQLCEQVITLYADMIHEKKLAVQLEINPTHNVIADPHILSAILRNIIRNAIKFTPTGGNIRIESTDHASTQIRIHIKDSGIGMNPDQIRALLHQKSIPSNRGTSGEKGTGLGLIICRELIHRMGGTLKIESEQGKGSDIGFSLIKPSLNPKS